MDLRHISRSEIIAAVGGALLALGVFLPWYVPNTDNRNANVNGARDAVNAGVRAATNAYVCFLDDDDLWYFEHLETLANAARYSQDVAWYSDAVSAFDTYSILRWLLLAAAVAPIVLLYIVVRDHELSWPRGEMTAVIGIIAFGLTAYVGIIDRPGEPPSEISLGFIHRATLP